MGRDEQILRDVGQIISRRRRQSQQSAHHVCGDWHEIKQKNASFANAARQGKNPTKPSRQDQLAKRSPIPPWALGAVIFVVCGGGEL